MYKISLNNTFTILRSTRRYKKGCAGSGRFSVLVVGLTCTFKSKILFTAFKNLSKLIGFLRIHRSYIVSISKIESYNTDTLEIEKKELPIGRLFKHDVSKLLNASTVRPNPISLKKKSGSD